MEERVRGAINRQAEVSGGLTLVTCEQRTAEQAEGCVYFVRR